MRPVRESFPAYRCNIKTEILSDIIQIPGTLFTYISECIQINLIL